MVERKSHRIKTTVRQLSNAITGNMFVKFQFHELYLLNNDPKIDAGSIAKLYNEILHKELGKMYAIGHLIHYRSP